MEAADLLDRGTRSRDPKLTRFCTRLGEDAAVDVDVRGGAGRGADEQPRGTNAASGSAVAQAKLRLRSDGGCRFVERILTAVQTLRLQKRPVLAYLQAAIAAHREGASTPSLIQTG
ncbi:MAG: hypothetical protein U0744_21130 [Gemmataceae bacterium]